MTRRSNQEAQGPQRRHNGNRARTTPVDGGTRNTWKANDAKGKVRRADSSLRPVFYHPIPNNESDYNHSINHDPQMYLSFLYILAFMAFLCFLIKLN